MKTCMLCHKKTELQRMETAKELSFEGEVHPDCLVLYFRAIRYLLLVNRGKMSPREAIVRLGVQVPKKVNSQYWKELADPGYLVWKHVWDNMGVFFTKQKEWDKTWQEVRPQLRPPIRVNRKDDHGNEESSVQAPVGGRELRGLRRDVVPKGGEGQVPRDGADELAGGLRKRRPARKVQRGSKRGRPPGDDPDNEDGRIEVVRPRRGG